jgi:hypothetical protein
MEGIGNHGFDLNSSLGLGEKKDWDTSLSYAHLHTTVGTESETNQVQGGLSHPIGDAWEAHGDLTFWKDIINEIKYVGPTAGFTYKWREETASSEPSPKAQKSDPSDEGYQFIQEAMGNSESSPKVEKKDDPSNSESEAPEILSATLDADLFAYSTEVIASSTTRKVYDAKLGRYVTEVVPPRTATPSLTQFHPNLTIEKPLFDEALTPYLIYGHYFYSRNPAVIEALAGRPRLAAFAGHLNALVGGFLNNNASVGLKMPWPWEVNFNGQFGFAQSATDNTWATIQEVTLDRTFLKHLKLKLDWSRSIQSGTSEDLFTGGLTYLF